MKRKPAICGAFSYWGAPTAAIAVYARSIEQLDDNALNVFTDGSALLHRPGRPGGWAFIYYMLNTKGEEEPFERAAPNAIPGSDAPAMELLAVIEALRFALSPLSPVRLDQLEKVVLWTDSTYIFEGFSTMVNSWSKNQWNRAAGAPLMHADDWRELYRLRRRFKKPVIAKWIPGKSSLRAKRVHKLAKASAEGAPGNPRRIQNIRRKWTDEPLETAKITVKGQELEIRILGIEKMPLHNDWRITFEVVSGPDKKKTGRAFFHEALRQKNIYTVRLNDNPYFPRIAEVLSEVPAADHEANPRFEQ